MSSVQPNVREFWRRFSFLRKGGIARDAALLGGGAALSQALNLAFYPLITRLYAPEALGVLGVFTALAAALTPLASLSLHLGINLPKREEDAWDLVSLTITVGVGVATATLLALVLGADQFAAAAGLTPLAAYYSLLPLTVFLLAVQQAAQQFRLRQRLFWVLSLSYVAAALTSGLGRILFGLNDPSSVSLALTFSFGLAVQVLCISPRQIFSRTLNSWRPSKLRDTSALLASYRRLVFFRTPQDFLNAVSQGVPVALLAYYYGPAEAGFFALARSVVGAPLDLIGNAIGNALYPRLASATHSGAPIAPLLRKATGGLLLLGLAPATLGWIVLPPAFGLLFGTGWDRAGVFGGLIVLWLVSILINVPSVRAIPILHLEKVQLLFGIALLFARAGAFVFAASWGYDAIVATTLFVVASVVANILITGVVLQTAGWHATR